MLFEFDKKKSASNKEKHGIDFIGAQELWKQEIVVLHSKNKDEKRQLVIGKIDNQFWTAIITARGKEQEITRIISVRRSRSEEKEIYNQR